MNTTTRAQRINKRHDAIWEAYQKQRAKCLMLLACLKDTQSQEKPRTEAPDVGTGQSESKPN